MLNAEKRVKSRANTKDKNAGKFHGKPFMKRSTRRINSPLFGVYKPPNVPKQGKSA
jgi:hypothetical protein